MAYTTQYGYAQDPPNSKTGGSGIMNQLFSDPADFLPVNQQSMHNTLHDNTNTFGTEGYAEPPTPKSSGSATSLGHDGRFALPTMPSSASRKRHRGSADSTSAVQRPAPNSRPSASPRASSSSTSSTPSTPHTDESLGFELNSTWASLLGGDPQEYLREMRKEQEEIDRRRAQEVADAELARLLQEEVGSSSSHQYTATPFTSSPNHASRQRSFPGFRAVSQNLDQLSSPSGPSGYDGTNEAKNMYSSPTPATPQKSIPIHPATPSSRYYSSPTFNRTPQTNAGFITIEDDDGDSNDQKLNSTTSNPVVTHMTPTLQQPRQNEPDIIDLLSEDSPPTTTSPADLTGSSTHDNYNLSYGTSNGYFDDIYSNSLYPVQYGYGGVYPQSSYDMNGGGYPGTYNPSLWTNTSNSIFQPLASAANSAYTAAGNLISNPLNAYGQSSASRPSSSSVDYLDLTGDDYLQTPQLVPASRLNDDRGLLDRYPERFSDTHGSGSLGSDDVKKLLENIRPDEELSPESREGTPEAMVRPLMEHQKNGLAWMKKMEEGASKGGILADEMGLGKTIQAIALLLSRRSTNPKRKTTLIVAPVALLQQWKREIEGKVRSGPGALSTFILHGSTTRDLPWQKLMNYDVVLTSMGTLGSEFKRKEAIDMQKRANPNWQPTSKNDRLPLLGDECKWYRVILDEAQCIKTKTTKASLAAASLQSEYRWCMTGTPMMNNVGELYPYLRFLRIRPYNQERLFKAEIVNPISKSMSAQGQKQAMQKLQALLKAVLLRRTKKSRIDGKPILSLPEKTISAENAEFSEDERAFYNALESKTQLQVNKYLKNGTLGQNYSSVLVLLLRLRQCCCHPHLCNKDFLPAGGSLEISHAKMVQLAATLKPDVVARIRASGSQSEEAALDCPVCMDTAANATIFVPCGHSTCSECFTRITDPSQAIAAGDGDGHGGGKCPECRGKVSPDKVIDHDTFKEVHQPELLRLTIDDLLKDEDGTTDEDDSSDDDDDDDDVDEKGNLSGFVVGDNEDSDGEDKAGIKRYLTAQPAGDKKRRKGKGKGKAKVRKTLGELKKESSRNTAAKKKYLARLRKDYVPSGKIEKAMELLKAVYAREDGAKTIVFSQFTSLLDLLEIPITDEGWDYKRYDGSMNSNLRNQAVVDFTDKPEIRLMLVSLKAGNAGLNLTSASEVIIFDPFWNPYVEDQAIDRAHRIGQTRKVNVHRIFVPETVEDRILALQEKKRSLIEGALDEKAAKSIARLGTRELTYLFGLRGNV